MGIWPGLAPYLCAALDPTTAPAPPAATTSAAAAPAATPLAPLLHFATTVGARRAEEERRLARRFGGAMLDIEVRGRKEAREVEAPLGRPPSIAASHYPATFGCFIKQIINQPINQSLHQSTNQSN